MFTKAYHDIEEEYAIVKGGTDLLDWDTEKEFIGIRKTKHGFEALAANRKRIEKIFSDMVILEKPTLEDIMLYTKKGREQYASSHT